MTEPRLRVGDFGDEVARLHESLQEQGLTISPEEQKRKFFGPTTRGAVGTFQSATGIDPTCDVCEATANKLQLPDKSSDAIHDEIPERPGTFPDGRDGLGIPKGGAGVLIGTIQPIAPSGGGISERNGPIIGHSGASVANLQDALRLLLDREVVRTSSPPNQLTDEELATLSRRLIEEERPKEVFGKATQQLVRLIQLQEGLDAGLDGAVEAKTARRLNEILKSLGAFEEPQSAVVRGTVRDATGVPVPQLIVRAFDRDMRRRELLGEASTDTQGWFEIAYASERFVRAELRGPDLQVQVFDPTTLDRMVAESAVLFNAATVATIDITLSDATSHRSELETYVDAVTPLLEGQADDGGNLTIAGLNDADLEFLASETSIANQHLVWLRAAFVTGANIEHDLGYAACYAWFRKGIDPSLQAIRTHAAGVLRQMLVDAIDWRIVPASLKQAIDPILERLDPADWGAIRKLVGGIGLTDAHASAVARRLGNVEAIDEVTLRGLVEAGALKRANADRLGLAASLHRLMDASTAAVDLALGRSFDSLGKRTLGKSEDLARLTRADWTALLSDSAMKLPAGLTLEEMGRELEELCAGAYPAVAMIQRAVRAEPEGVLKTLVSRNPGVDVLSLDLTADSPDVAALDLSELTEEKCTRAVTQLRAMQRVLTAAGHPTSAQKLLDAGYGTATRIALATQAELVEQAGMQESEAVQVLDRAQTMSQQAVHAWMAVREAQMDSQMINGAGTTIQWETATGTQIARWADLFGEADFCACDHCQSVVGPGAYFVDLMHYVEEFILKPSTTVSVPMQLATRRSDLWTDKLVSCKSADEVVPTLDIVNALLERRITKQKPQWASSQEIHRNLTNPASSTPDFGMPMNSRE